MNNKKIEYFGIGRRKKSIARVKLVVGKGEVYINKKKIDLNNNFILIYKPFFLTKTLKSYDVFVNVYGGGVNGQINAIVHGISRALLQVNPDFKNVLKKFDLIKRDDRMVERKKPGLKKSRKAPQFSKR